MNIDSIVFPSTEQSYFSNEQGQLCYYFRYQFQDCKIPDIYDLPEEYYIKSNGRLFYLKSEFNNITSHIPVYYEKSYYISDNYILYFHMNSDDLGDVFRLMDTFTGYFNGLNMNVLAMEYPGYGTYKDATVSEELLTHNSTIVYDFVKSYFKVGDENIFLYGRSIGTCVALKLASLRTPNSVFVVSPIYSIREIVKYWIGKYLDWTIKSYYTGSEYINLIKSKLLVIHGEKDQVVHVEHAKLIKNANPAKVDLHLLEEYGHQNIPYTVISNIIIEWLRKNNIYRKENVAKISTDYYVEFPKEYYRNVVLPSRAREWEFCSCLKKKEQKYQIVNEAENRKTDAIENESVLKEISEFRSKSINYNELETTGENSKLRSRSN